MSSQYAMPDDTIRVLVVDDAVTYRHTLRNILDAMPRVEVVGTAIHGRAALEQIERLDPDLLVLDMQMPELDGLGVLRELKHLPDGPDAIMMLDGEDDRVPVRAQHLGAFDCIVKPPSDALDDLATAFRAELHRKLLAFRQARSPRPAPCSAAAECEAQQDGPAGMARVAAPDNASSQAEAGTPPAPSRRAASAVQAVVVGVSTGGPDALNALVPELPAELAAPVLVVQHMPPRFTRSLAQTLNKRARLTVQEAVEGRKIVPGTILVAPGGKHMGVGLEAGQPVVRLSDDPPENHCRPSVDYLFRSAAQHWGPGVLGVIMTGMGNDGSAGCLHIKRCGGTIIAQDEASCVVYGMPREPIESGWADAVVPLERIAHEITRRVGRKAALCN